VEAKMQQPVVVVVAVHLISSHFHQGLRDLMVLTKHRVAVVA
jgi:hypothetical protein